MRCGKQRSRRTEKLGRRNEPRPAQAAPRQLCRRSETSSIAGPFGRMAITSAVQYSSTANSPGSSVKQLGPCPTLLDRGNDVWMDGYRFRALRTGCDVIATGDVDGVHRRMSVGSSRTAPLILQYRSLHGFRTRIKADIRRTTSQCHKRRSLQNPSPTDTSTA